ncbi:MAG: type II toxin-antitoxin system antitoxin, RelB/DinJ family [Fibrobacter sp.]|nr:type II toxin-antitoxin system antitoxin, RelB/DinJ family [Fibrobacter sp.]
MTRWGMDLPTAIRVFLKRAVAEKAIPFEVREPRTTYSANRGIAALRALQAQAEANGVAGMSEEEIEAEITAYRSGK